MLIKPKNQISDIVAKIKTVGDSVCVVFPEYNKDFRKIMRGMSFTWNYPLHCWQRGNFMSGIDDFQCEVAYTILSNGFMVEIETMFIEKITNKTFNFEPNGKVARVIAKSRFNDYFMIKWNSGKNFYKQARLMSGSLYCKPWVCIPKEQFREVLDFADINNFVLSDGANKLLEIARGEFENCIEFKPVESEEAKDDFGVLPDLIDL